MHYIKQAKQFSFLFWDLARKAKSILITSHLVPDDDSIASVLSVYNLLHSRWPRKNIRIIYSSLVKERWGGIKNFSVIEQNKEVANLVNKFDLVIFLDGNYFERFSNQADKLRLIVYSQRLTTICIDHHHSRADDFSLSLIVPQASATAELIYYALVENQKEIDSDLAKVLLLGLLGDTGFWGAISPTNAHLLSIAERLVRVAGVSLEELKTKYMGLSQKEFVILRLLFAQAKTIKIKGWPPFLLACLPREKTRLFNDNQIDTAAHFFVNTFVFNPGVKEIEWGVVFYPLFDGRVRVSLRSRLGGVNVRKIVEGMKVGSGHNHSSGGVFWPAKQSAKLDVRGPWLKMRRWLKANPL
jgi:phosphoesterase RecJ-like protein